MSRYRDALCQAMSLCAAEPGALFIGQSVLAGGTAMRASLEHIDSGQLIEFPVAENLQLGVSIGLSLAGHLPISIYPRINFLLEATSQLVQHLDALPRYSDYRPRVIIRTAVAYHEPLDPGAQHLGDPSAALGAMLRTVRVRKLWLAQEIVQAYREALQYDGSTLLVEYARRYET